MKILASQKLASVNPNKEPLTIEKLKTYPGFESLPEEKLQEILFSIQNLSAFMYEFLRQLQSQEGKKEGIELNSNFKEKQAA